MNYLDWTFLSLFVVSLGLYIFFYIKGKSIPKDIFKILLLPFSAAFLVSRLTIRIPDSFHIISILILSFIFSEAFLILQLLFQKKQSRPLEIAAFASFFMAIEVWNNLFFSAIYLVRIPDWFNILIIIDLFAGFITFCLVTRPRIIKIYFFYFAAFAISGLLCFTSLAELIFGKKLYGIPLFIGTLTMLLDLLFTSARPKWTQKKHSQMIMNMSLIAAELLISSAAFIMIF